MRRAIRNAMQVKFAYKNGKMLDTTRWRSKVFFLFEPQKADGFSVSANAFQKPYSRVFCY